MCVLNIRYVPVISGNHLISCHTSTDTSLHMPANNRHEQLHRSYKILVIDLSRKQIHYSDWIMYVYDSVKWNKSRPTFEFLLHFRPNILKLSEDKKSMSKIGGGDKQKYKNHFNFFKFVFNLLISLLEIFLGNVFCLAKNTNLWKNSFNNFSYF